MKSKFVFKFYGMYFNNNFFLWILILRSFGFPFKGKFSNIFEKEVKIKVKDMEVLKDYLKGSCKARDNS